MEYRDIFGQVEQQLDLAFAALREGDARALEQLTASVLVSTQNLAQMTVTEPLSRSRLQQVAVQVQSLREAVMRHAVMADQMLQILVPAIQSHTYGAGVAGASASAYGGVARASGRMAQVLKA